MQSQGCRAHSEQHHPEPLSALASPTSFLRACGNPAAVDSSGVIWAPLLLNAPFKYSL